MDITRKRVALVKAASFRAMGEEGVILMTDTGQLYSTNESGTAFMKRIVAGHSVRAAVDGLLDEFDVAEEDLLDDLSELVGYLESEGVVVTDDA